SRVTLSVPVTHTQNGLHCAPQSPALQSIFRQLRRESLSAWLLMHCIAPLQPIFRSGGSLSASVTVATGLSGSNGYSELSPFGRRDSDGSPMTTQLECRCGFRWTAGDNGLTEACPRCGSPASGRSMTIKDRMSAASRLSGDATVSHTPSDP